MFYFSIENRSPRNVKLAVVGCFYPPIVVTTTTGLTPTRGTVEIIETTGMKLATETRGSTATPAPTTTALPPTTTTMSYCTEQKGMNEPLTILPTQVTSNLQPEETQPAGNINPTPTTFGLNYPSMNPQINVTLDQPATLTLIYVPVDRANQPSNVDEFLIVFVYPNGSISETFTSHIPSRSETTPSETTTTPSTQGVFPPSKDSPQVDLPPNFQVPEGTKVMIMISSTKDTSNAVGVCVKLDIMFVR
jgi:hypothetical protein